MSTVKTAILASLLTAHFQQAPEAAPQLTMPAIQLDAPSVLDGLQFEAEELLSDAGIDGVVSGRIKSPESMAAKMRRKGLLADEVLDRVALRVRVGTVAECYEVYERLLDRYPAVQGAYDDYIASPKANGYQSLHAALYTPSGVVEFQVRTHEMHTYAETGGAAHWRYKYATLFAVS